MNKFTLYTNSENLSLEFICLCQEKLISNKSEIVVLKEGIDFNISDLKINSLPALKFSFIDLNGDLQYEKTFKNFEESILYLKNQFLI